MKKALMVGMLVVVGITGKASATTPSGMMLGIYAHSNWNGLFVNNTIPGYPAEGYLFPGDVITRATADGHPIYSIRNMWDLENLKSRFGPYRFVALEVYRPNFGQIYLWVTFVPVGGGSIGYGAPAQAQVMGSAPAVKTRMFSESERPGAAQMFQKNGGSTGNGQRQGSPMNGGQMNGGQRQGNQTNGANGRNAQSLFNR